MRYKPCGYRWCTELINANLYPAKKYHSKACKQAAYRDRRKEKKVFAKITLTRYCVNCGKQFTTTRVRQQFHSESCRVSFHQQQKRLAQKAVTQSEE